MTVSSMFRSGCISLNRVTIPSITARGAGLDMSEKIFRSPVSGVLWLPARAPPANMADVASAVIDALSMERIVVLPLGSII